MSTDAQQEPQAINTQLYKSPMQARAIWAIPLIALPLLAVLLVLAHWASSGTEVTYFTGTGPLTELLAGQKFSQTITPIYPGLSAIGVQVGDYGRVNTGTLTLRLYEAGSATEIAESSLPESGMRNNPTIWFEFPPLAGQYRGKQLRFDLEDPTGVSMQSAVTFFSSTLDPYSGGNFFFNGRAEPSVDLLFGMRYSISPLEVVGAQFAQWAGEVPGPLALLAGLGFGATLGGCVWLLVALAINVRNALAGKGAVTTRRPGWQALLLFTLLGLANSITWALFTPPWHGPDEPAHTAFATILAKQGAFGQAQPDPVVRASIVASMDQHRFLRYVPWAFDPAASADLFLARPGYYSDTIWVQTRQPKLYYGLIALVFHLPGLAPDDPNWPTAGQIDGLLYAARGVSVALQTLLVALAWLAGRALRAPGASGALAFAVALLPMPVFIHAMVNNDVLASVAGGVLALYAIRAIQRFRWVDLILLVGGLILVYFSKGTALPAAALAALALLLGFWLRAGRVIKIALAVVAAALVIAPLALFYGALNTTDYAARWLGSDFFPAQRVAVPDAQNGAFTLSLSASKTFNQRLDLPAHGVFTATTTIWARGANGRATLQVGYNATPPTSTTTITTTAAWQQLQASAVIPADAQSLTVYLRPGAGSVQFDNASIAFTDSAGAPAALPVGLLQNPSFEQGARVVDLNLPGLKRGSTTYLMLSYIADPARLDLFWGKMQSLFISFWADFGWVAVQLPEWSYVVWGWVIGLALLGGFMLIISRAQSDEERARKRYLVALFVLFTLIGVGDALFSFLRTAITTISYGSNEFPQGRYLFPLLIPLVAVGALGFYGWGQFLKTRLPTSASNVGGAWLRYSGATLLIAYGLLAFSAIMTFYYGQ